MRLNLGGVTAAGTSLKYKTGKWRRERPEIDQAICKRCGICADACPDSAVKAIDQAGKSKPLYVIDYDYCKGCGLCARECPLKAIAMIPEE